MALWGFLLPIVYVLASSITNILFKDALILKVGFSEISEGCESRHSLAQLMGYEGEGQRGKWLPARRAEGVVSIATRCPAAFQSVRIGPQSSRQQG